MRDVLAQLESDAEVDLFVVENDLSNLAEAQKAAGAADLVVLMAGLVATEGADMPDANMINNQNGMLDELLEVNPNTVLVLKNSAPVLMPWIDKAPTVLEVWNQGTEDGHVVADLLFGLVNPSGKVPTTYPRSADDTLYAHHVERYPGTDEGAGYPVIRYSEGLAMGYRWFQSQGIDPLFCFGYGLSYTTFEVSDVEVDAAGFDGSQPVVVRGRVANTGERAGAEVVQVYLGIPVDGQPPKRLVGFQKVPLEAGESADFEIVIDPAASNHPFSVWDYCSRGWAVKPGDYTVFVGTSSEDTPFSSVLTVG